MTQHAERALSSMLTVITDRFASRQHVPGAATLLNYRPPVFTIFLESPNFERLATIAKHGNVYLMRDEAAFPLLGDLADCSYDVFGSQRMPELIAELRRVKDELQAPEDLAHVDGIIALAERCAREPGTRLIFTPFEPIS
jgi:hypothetical protein